MITEVRLGEKKMKRKTARDIIVESFRELAQKKTVDKITIQNIVDNCGYSSATFYRQFRDKYDLIAWAYSQDLEKILDKIDFAEKGWKECLLAAAFYYKEHREYLSNLLLHTSGYDAFVLNMTEINYSNFLRKVSKSSTGESMDEKMKMMIRIYVTGTVCFTCEWILGKYQADPEMLTEVYMLSIPEPIKKYLY